MLPLSTAHKTSCYDIWSVKNLSLIPKGSLTEQLEEENRGGTGSQKTAIKMKLGNDSYMYICKKNCSLYTLLTAMDQKPQKS